MKRNLPEIVKEICDREKQNGRDTSMTQVKRVVRHLCDMIAEEWVDNHDLDISAALRRNGMGRIKKKNAQ